MIRKTNLEQKAGMRSLLGCKLFFAALLCNISCLLYYQDCNADDLHSRTIDFNGETEFSAGQIITGTKDSIRSGPYASSMSMLNCNISFNDIARIQSTMKLFLCDGKRHPYLSKEFISLGEGKVEVSLHRLYIQSQIDKASIWVGRQIIWLGRNARLSALDFFSEISIEDKTFEKTSWDAVRICIPTGDISGFEGAVGYESVDYTKNGAALWRFGNFKGMDYALFAGYRNDWKDAIAAVSVKGDLVVGLSGEILQRIPINSTKQDKNPICAAGIDYSLTDGLITSIEYKTDFDTLGIIDVGLLFEKSLFWESRLDFQYSIEKSNLISALQVVYYLRKKLDISATVIALGQDLKNSKAINGQLTLSLRAKY